MLSLEESLSSTRTLVFDCDGVVLNSNRIKTEAFRVVASRYGQEAASALVAYHLSYGGISRYRKFEYFLRVILGRSYEQAEVQAMANEYSEQVCDALMQAEVTVDLKGLRRKTLHCSWMMVSGGDEDELRQVLKGKGLDKLFDGGIHGSPASKDEIFLREKTRGTLDNTAIYIGDSQYDHQAAQRANLHFVFASAWTEFQDWSSYCKTHAIPVIARVSDLAEAFEVE